MIITQMLSVFIVIDVCLSIIIWLLMNYKMLFLIHARFSVFGISLRARNCCSISKCVGGFRYEMTHLIIEDKTIKINNKISIYNSSELLSGFKPCAVLAVKRRVRIVVPLSVKLINDIENSYIKACNIAIPISLLLEVLYVSIQCYNI